ncbi:uncharacterized protein LOC107834914 [Poecilia formosa]|uniref:uncharacterized protein LOC107834914 n=1 Tax=Poecilia formosa TaxID=48698 RepID=UPI0007B7EECB|nr:PREDICTED: uncharacterized protein LOC107834914 [Poecilia formosa]
MQPIASIKPTVTWKPDWSEIFRGETVTLRCEIRGGAEWTYEWRINDQDYPASSESISITADSGRFGCIGTRNDESTQWSDFNSLPVSTNKARATMTERQTIIPAGGSVTLRCSVDIGDGWRIYWFRQDPDQPVEISEPDGVFIISDEGVYSCRGGRGGRGGPVFYTETSREVTIWKTVSIKPTITWKHNWPPIFSGETVTLRCEIRGGGSQWMYEWEINDRNSPSFDEYKNISARNGDRFRCRGRGNYQFTQWSDDLSLTVSK